MPSPSAAKRRGSMVRQLSLQGQPTSQSPAGRRGLKKQLSEEEGRTRASEPVEVTGQGWNGGGDKPEAGLRVSSGEGTRTGQQKTGARPRPVKLAWTDRRHDSTECPTGVEVVARKCQGQPRPVTAKAQRVTNLPLLGDKDTLVYSRQQLAERLRRAWREREKNRPNLDIFLAQSSESARSEEPPTERSVIPQTDIFIQDPTSGTDKRRSEPVRTDANHSVCFTSGVGTVTKNSGVKIQASYFATKPIEPKGILKSAEPKSEAKKLPVKAVEETVRHLQEQNKIEIRVSRCESPDDSEKNDTVAKNPALADLLDFKTFPVADASKKFGIDFSGRNFQMKSIDVPAKRSPNEPPMKVKHSRNKENMGNSVMSMSESPRSDSSYSERSKIGKLDDVSTKEEDKPMEEEVEQQPPLTASARRASFRSSSILNKTITGSFSSPLPNSSGEFDDEGPHHKNEIKVVLTKSNGQRPPLMRTLSAPSRNEPPTANQQQTNQPKSMKLNPQRRLIAQPIVSMDISGINNEEDLIALRDRIKSAPTRRKLKTAAARRKNKDKGGESSEDEKEVRDTSATAKKTTRRRPVMKNGGDIVTMVSLVSPATSDTEDSVIHLPVDTWTAEDKEEPAQNASTPATSSDEPRDATSFIIQKFVSLRKTTKTVSFQQHPPINRSYSASFPSRRVPAGTPIIIPTPVISNPALTPAQLQEREKRPPATSGIVASADSRGVKRRLVRTTSAPLKEDEASSDENSKTDTSTEPVYDSLRSPASGERRDEAEDDEDDEDDPNREPEFKSPKERECWMLYRKMLEKGVSVSYDTVLRGMLTPTEYRLRKNQLLSSC